MIAYVWASLLNRRTGEEAIPKSFSIEIGRRMDTPTKNAQQPTNSTPALQSSAANNALDNQSQEAQTAQAATALDARRMQLSPGGDQGNNLGKVRDILFGSQMRDYDKRFVRLEERLLKVSAEMKEDLRRRFDSLETYVKHEVELLTDQIKTEHSQRAETLATLSRELKDASSDLDKKLAQLDGQTAKTQRDLRQQILEQSKNLSDEIQQRYEEMSAVVDQSVQELRTDKTDRNTLADLFTEVAMRLNNEFTIPDE
jgi:hypothetical protein